MEKRILILANSRKLSGRCLAGKEIAAGRAPNWIRPVSARATEEVSEYDRQYEDGTDPQVLDVASVPLVVPRPKAFQSENWLLDEMRYWRKEGNAAWADLAAFEDAPAHLWIDGHNTYHGMNDEIPLVEAERLNNSLVLLRVNTIEIHVFAPNAAFNNPKRRVQGRFEYRGTPYWLWVTDPRIELRYRAQGDGAYQIGECYLTISLGEPFNGFTYKLIAAIIER